MDTASFSPISLNDVIPKWNDAPDYVLSIIRKLVSGGIGLLIFRWSTELGSPSKIVSTRYSLFLQLSFVLSVERLMEEL